MSRSTVVGCATFLAALVLAGPAAAGGPDPVTGDVGFVRQQCTPAPCTSDIWTVSPFATDLQQFSNLGDATHPAGSWNGERIAFVHDGGIYTMKFDGTDLQHVLDWPLEIGRMAWSPDGGKLAVALGNCDEECRLDLHTVNIDGTGLTNLAPDFFEERNPTWSPDGTHIAFDSPRDSAYNIWMIGADGTGQTQITQRTSGADTWPTWSPVADRIVFESDRAGGSDLYSMKSDGTEITNLTAHPPAVFQPSGQPAFSLDGSQLAFRGSRNNGPGIYRMLATGGSALRLTDQFLDFEPTWLQSTDGPPQVSGEYARPRGATPIVTYFVPAYRSCETPNMVHGPPLAEPSCNPPVEASSELTIGTADANNKPTRGVASARIYTIVGNPGTLDDEADVAIQLGTQHVFRRSTMTDYTGEIDVRLNVRITDRDNFPTTGNVGGGTVEDFVLRIPGSCVATADPNIGSSCGVDTTFDSITPGMIREGARAIWQLGQVQIYDGGTDGEAATDPNELFQVQGLFVP